MKVLRTKQFASIPASEVNKMVKEALAQGKLRRSQVPAYLATKEELPIGYSTRLKRMVAEAKKKA